MQAQNYRHETPKSPIRTGTVSGSNLLRRGTGRGLSPSLRERKGCISWSQKLRNARSRKKLTSKVVQNNQRVTVRSNDFVLSKFFFHLILTLPAFVTARLDYPDIAGFVKSSFAWQGCSYRSLNADSSWNVYAFDDTLLTKWTSKLFVLLSKRAHVVYLNE